MQEDHKEQACHFGRKDLLVHAIIERLSDRFANIMEPNSNSKELIEKWIERPLPLSCWELWTLLGLVRHRDRQQFVADTITHRLGADLEALAEFSMMLLPDYPGRGVVPGESDWEYYFHERGCCFTNRGSGEVIDVDFLDSTADWIVSSYYEDYLASLRTPSFVEERVIGLHPSYKTVAVDINGLLDAELLHSQGQNHSLCLTFDHRPLAKLVSALEASWHDDSVRTLVAAAVGDWPLLETLPLEDHVATKVRINMKASQEARGKMILDESHPDIFEPLPLRALAEADFFALRGILEAALYGSASPSVSEALEIVGEMDVSTWHVQLERLLNRIDPNSRVPAPSNWIRALELLLKQGKGHDFADRLPLIESHVLGEAALLALEHLPHMAVDLFRRALRSTVPLNRITAAAALALLDQPWCHDELATVLEESTDQYRTAECRSALLLTQSEEYHRRVHAWEKLKSHELEEDEQIEHYESKLPRKDATIRLEVLELHDRVMPLKTALTPNGKVPQEAGAYAARSNLAVLDSPPN